jgi:hypothetical protein
LKNTIRGMLALAFVFAACGDDGGSGDDDTDDKGSEEAGRPDTGGGDDDDSGSEETDGGTDGGSLTLDQALKTDGVDVSQERVDLIFPAACEEQRKCTQDTQAACLAENQDVYEAMAANRPEACRDATLDLYACFATTDCADYDTDDRCNELGTKQISLCGM